MMLRRSAPKMALAVASMVGVLAANAAHAQAYPSRPVKVVIPQPLESRVRVVRPTFRA